MIADWKIKHWARTGEKLSEDQFGLSNSQKVKLIQHGRRKNGFCPKCGKDPGRTHIYCQPCREKHNQNEKSRKEFLKRISSTK